MYVRVCLSVCVCPGLYPKSSVFVRIHDTKQHIDKNSTKFTGLRQSISRKSKPIPDERPDNIGKIDGQAHSVSSDMGNDKMSCDRVRYAKSLKSDSINKRSANACC